MDIRIDAILIKNCTKRRVMEVIAWIVERIVTVPTVSDAVKTIINDLKIIIALHVTVTKLVIY
jgi:hypothetical protein